MADALAAGPLQIGTDYQKAVRTYLGARSVNVQYDTAALNLAINDGIYRVSIDVGSLAHDTVTITEDVSDYTLDTIFISNGTAALPINVMYVKADNSTRHGLRRRDKIEDFTMTRNKTEAQEFIVRDNVITISPASVGSDKLYIDGPLAPLWIKSDTSHVNIDVMDEFGVVYWAVGELLASRQNYAGAQDWFGKYLAHVKGRGGVYMGPPVPGGQ